MLLSYNRMLKQAEIRASSFERLILRDGASRLLRMRSSDFNGLDIMVSLSNHKLVVVRQAHREAMGGIVFQQPDRRIAAVEAAVNAGDDILKIYKPFTKTGSFRKTTAPEAARTQPRPNRAKGASGFIRPL